MADLLSVLMDNCVRRYSEWTPWKKRPGPLWSGMNDPGDGPVFPSNKDSEVKGRKLDARYSKGHPQDGENIGIH